MMGATRSGRRSDRSHEDPELDESTTLLDALRVHLAPGPGRASRLHRLRRFVDATKGEDPEGLTPLAGFTWRRRDARRPTGGTTAHAGKTLRECLEGVGGFPGCMSQCCRRTRKVQEPDA